jgi:opacity protein-like surface antigen
MLHISTNANCQDTQIRGFADFVTSYRNDQANFSLGEQDLFITSDISDRISFLGETVFKFSNNSPTKFDISIERIILKYNIKGNHNILVGKHHTPVNYWNDTYHHGRVFFPTIFRPSLFSEGVIPIHTTGLHLQGQNLGKLRFGYDALIGNGEASNDAVDFNKMKSVLLGVSIKPIDGMKLGLNYYHDDIPAGASLHHSSIVGKSDVNQSLYSAYVSYFGNKFELLAESSVAINKNDSTGTPVSPTGYIYSGYRIKEKLVPYFMLDVLNFNSREVLFSNLKKRGALIGIRYEINYLAVIKLEFSYLESQAANTSESNHSSHFHSQTNSINFQFAVGF